MRECRPCKLLSTTQVWTVCAACSRQGHTWLLLTSVADPGSTNPGQQLEAALQVVEVLLQAPGANLSSPSALGETPLNLATQWKPCTARHAAIFGLVLEACAKAGLDINGRDKFGRTPLFYAALAGADLRLVGMLLEAGARTDVVSNRGVHLAAAAVLGGRLELVELLCQAGLELPAAQLLLTSVEQVGKAQHLRERQERLAVFRHLLSSTGLHAGTRDERGASILHALASWREYSGSRTERQAFETILAAAQEAGVTLAAQDSLGRTPLHTAALSRAAPEIVRTMLVKGADARARDAEGRTTLELAQSAGGSAEWLASVEQHLRGQQLAAPAGTVSQRPLVPGAGLGMGSGAAAAAAGAAAAGAGAAAAAVIPAAQRAVRQGREGEQALLSVPSPMRTGDADRSASGMHDELGGEDPSLEPSVGMGGVPRQQQQQQQQRQRLGQQCAGGCPEQPAAADVAGAGTAGSQPASSLVGALLDLAGSGFPVGSGLPSGAARHGNSIRARVGESIAGDEPEEMQRAKRQRGLRASEHSLFGHEAPPHLAQRTLHAGEAPSQQQQQPPQHHHQQQRQPREQQQQQCEQQQQQQQQQAASERRPGSSGAAASVLPLPAQWHPAQELHPHLTLCADHFQEELHKLKAESEASGSPGDALVLSEVSRAAHAQMGLIASTTGAAGTARKVVSNMFVEGSSNYIYLRYSEWCGRALVPRFDMLGILRQALESRVVVAPESLWTVLEGDIPFRLWEGSSGLDPRKGRGVCTMNYIPPGECVLMYCGEYMPASRCERRRGQYHQRGVTGEYGWDLTKPLLPESAASCAEQLQCCVLVEKWDRKLLPAGMLKFREAVVDSTTKGSAARCINHSCEPNLRAVELLLPWCPPAVVFFSLRGILPGEELTLDYNPDLPAIELAGMANAIDCFCGSKKCKGKTIGLVPVD